MKISKALVGGGVVALLIGGSYAFFSGSESDPMSDQMEGQLDAGENDNDSARGLLEKVSAGMNKDEVNESDEHGAQKQERKESRAKRRAELEERRQKQLEELKLRDPEKYERRVKQQEERRLRRERNLRQRLEKRQQNN